MSRIRQGQDRRAGAEQPPRDAQADRGRGRARLDRTRDQGPAQDQSIRRRAVKNGRIKQSIVYWCFEKHWDMDQAAKVAKQLGCDSIELVAPSSSRSSSSTA